MPQAKQAQTETFFSKYAEHQIVMVHDTKMVVNGNQLFTTPSRIIKFSRGKLTTSEVEVIDFLKSHSAYGIDFFSSEDARGATIVKSEQAPEAATGEAPEVAKPVRTKKGEKATVARKPTTAADVDAETDLDE